MSNLKPKYTMISLGYTEMPDGTVVPKEYGMLFNLNAIDEIQDRFDISISDFGQLMESERKAYKAIKTIVTILVNEAIDDSESGEPHIAEAFVGRKIAASDIASTTGSILSAFTGSVPDVDDEEAGDTVDPTQSEQ